MCVVYIIDYQLTIWCSIYFYNDFFHLFSYEPVYSTTIFDKEIKLFNSLILKIMYNKLNWKKNLNLNYFHLKLFVMLISFLAIVIPANAQVRLIIKNRDINGDTNPFMKIGAVGVWPCAERFAISMEDSLRETFNATSAFWATLMPNGVDIDYPNDGYGDNGKRSLNETMSYQRAFERIRNLKPGYHKSVMGEKWTFSAEQTQELYPNQAYEVNYNNKARTAFNYNNTFFEMLISIQVLAKQNEEQQSIIEQQSATIEKNNERLQRIESILDIDDEFISQKTLGEVNINPNPLNGGTLVLTYQINQDVSNVQLIITDIQGKKVYDRLINVTQKKDNQNLNIDLPAGNYLYYLENNYQQTDTQKLTIL